MQAGDEPKDGTQEQAMRHRGRQGASERHESNETSCCDEAGEKKDREDSNELQNSERRRIKEAPRSTSEGEKKFGAHPGPTSKRVRDNNEQAPTKGEREAGKEHCKREQGRLRDKFASKSKGPHRTERERSK